MLICVAGDTHGALDRLYQDVASFEGSLQVQFEWVLHVGDFGVWPDPSRVDGATKRHDGAGDFPVWWAERRAAPRPTVFIKGNHEDFVWLDAQPSSEVLPGLHYLRNGATFDLGDGTIVGGVGGCYGPSNYGRPSGDLHGKAKRHYTREDIDTLLREPRVDILLTHDAPTGVVFPRHRQGANWASTARGLGELVEILQPRVCFFGHHHTRISATLHGTPCEGLNKVRCPGHLVAVEVTPGGAYIMDEW